MSVSTNHSDLDRRAEVSRLHLFSDATSEKSYTKSDTGSRQSGSLGNFTDVDSVPGLVTARFKHIVTAEGHAVITGRDGETLQRCEDEPCVPLEYHCARFC